MISKNSLEKIPCFQGIFFACSITILDIGINAYLALSGAKPPKEQRAK
jgi:hypothetical protein